MKIILCKTETDIKKITPTGDIKDAIKDIPKGAEYKIVDTTDKDYQDLSEVSLNYDSALTWDLKHDIVNLKEVKKNDIRQAREEKFKTLDYEFMKALEESRDYSDITKQKQVLRDLPQKVDACKTIDDIKKIEV